MSYKTSGCEEATESTSMQNSVFEQQNELLSYVQNPIDIATFPTLTFFIRGSIEKTPLMDVNNITHLISSYLYSQRYLYELDLWVDGHDGYDQFNYKYKAQIVATDPREFADIFSCVMDIEGRYGAYLTYENVLNNCVRIENNISYKSNIPYIKYLYRYIDARGDPSSYLCYEKEGTVYEEFDDFLEISVPYKIQSFKLYTQPDWYDKQNNLSQERRLELKTILSLESYIV